MESAESLRHLFKQSADLLHHRFSLTIQNVEGKQLMQTDIKGQFTTKVCINKGEYL